MDSATFSSICVYCGSAPGRHDGYAEAAHLLGRTLAQRGIRLVYGGGRVGLMGALADGALLAGGQVVGVIPEALMQRELGHPGVQELLVVRDMHERKNRMAELADAFVALPGGWGTLEELTEMLTWLQLGFHDKPIGILNVRQYFDPFFRFVEQMIEEGFVRTEHRTLYRVAATVEDLLAGLGAQRRPGPDGPAPAPSAHQRALGVK